MIAEIELKKQVMDYFDSNVGNMGKNSTLSKEAYNFIFGTAWSYAKKWNEAQSNSEDSIFKRLSFEQTMKIAMDSMTGIFNLDYFNATREIAKKI